MKIIKMEIFLNTEKSLDEQLIYDLIIIFIANSILYKNYYCNSNNFKNDISQN